MRQGGHQEADWEHGRPWGYEDYSRVQQGVVDEGGWVAVSGISGLLSSGGRRWRGMVLALIAYLR